MDTSEVQQRVTLTCKMGRISIAGKSCNCVASAAATSSRVQRASHAEGVTRCGNGVLGSSESARRTVATASKRRAGQRVRVEEMVNATSAGKAAGWAVNDFLWMTRAARTPRRSQRRLRGVCARVDPRQPVRLLRRQCVSGRRRPRANDRRDVHRRRRPARRGLRVALHAPRVRPAPLLIEAASIIPGFRVLTVTPRVPSLVAGDTLTFFAETVVDQKDARTVQFQLDDVKELKRHVVILAKHNADTAGSGDVVLTFLICQLSSSSTSSSPP